MKLHQSHKMSQENFGIRLGIKYQQIQKDESGQLRMPPERIAACARILEVPVEYFFGSNNDDKTPHYNKAVLIVAAEIMALPNDDVRKSFYHLARMINKSWDMQDNQPTKQKMKA